MSNLIELTENIEQWATDRKLHTADPIKQYDKLIEEFGELMKGINKHDMPMIKDSIGDMYVVLVVMSNQTHESMLDILANGGVETIRPQHSTFGYIRELNILAQRLNHSNLICYEVQAINNQMAKTCAEYEISIVDCVELAYLEIKDRKGEMRDGKFVKEADL